MLDISNSKIATVIMLAREGRSAEGQLYGFIADLNEDEKASLVAVMWIGRDTFDAEDLEEAMETARNEATTPTEDYLLGVPLLSDYLEAGLEKLGIEPGDLEEEFY